VCRSNDSRINLGLIYKSVKVFTQYKCLYWYIFPDPTWFSPSYVSFEAGKLRVCALPNWVTMYPYLVGCLQSSDYCVRYSSQASTSGVLLAASHLARCPCNSQRGYLNKVSIRVRQDAWADSTFLSTPTLTRHSHLFALEHQIQGNCVAFDDGSARRCRCINSIRLICLRLAWRMCLSLGRPFRRFHPSLTSNYSHGHRDITQVNLCPLHYVPWSLHWSSLLAWLNFLRGRHSSRSTWAIPSALPALPLGALSKRSLMPSRKLLTLFCPNCSLFSHPSKVFLMELGRSSFL